MMRRKKDRNEAGERPSYKDIWKRRTRQIESWEEAMNQQDGPGPYVLIVEYRASQYQSPVFTRRVVLALLPFADMGHLKPLLALGVVGIIEAV